MKTYLITFLNERGFSQQVYIEATNKERALLKFESEYTGSIKYCDEITDEITN